MRILIVILLSSFCIYTRAQKGGSYTIQGYISTKYEANKVYLTYSLLNNKTSYIDSCNINDGEFLFVGTLPYTIPATLSFVKQKDNNISYIERLNFHLDPQDITINYKYSSDSILISGSPTTSLFAEYLSRQQALQSEGLKLQSTYQKASPDQILNKQFKDSLDCWYKDLQERYDDMSLQFISEHPQSIIGVYMLISAIKTRPSNPNIETAFNSLSDSIQNSPPGKVLSDIIDKNRPLPIGFGAPNFTCNNQHGEEFRLSDIRGKYILLNFWAPDCNHCISEIQNLKKLYKTYGADKFEIVNVAIEYEDRLREWLDIITKENLDWINISDLNGWQSQVVKLYRVNAVPYNYLIDINGKIIAKDLHGAKLFNTFQFIFE